MRLIRDRRKGVWRWGRGELYTCRYTVTTRMTSALRWAAIRAILMFHNREKQSHKTVSTDHNFRSERRAEADSNRGPSAYQANALPLGQTGSHVPLVEFMYLVCTRMPGDSYRRWSSNKMLFVVGFVWRLLSPNSFLCVLILLITIMLFHFVVVVRLCVTSFEW